MKSVLQGIGIIFTLIASFLGNLYFLNGDIIISSFISCIIVVVLYFLQETFIKKKSEISKNKFSSTSIVLWTLYLLLSVPITLSLIHSLNVELNEKKNIQQIAAIKQDDLMNMLKDDTVKHKQYLQTFKGELGSLLIKYKDDKIRKISNPGLINKLQNAPYEIPVEFFQDNASNVENQVSNSLTKKEGQFNKLRDTIRSRINDYNNKYKTVFSNWSRLQLSIASTEIDKVLNQNHTQIANGFKRLADIDYQYPYNKQVIEINHPKDLWDKHKPYLLLIVVFLFHILILLPYIIEPVAGRYISTKKVNKPTSGGIQI
jgi:hypothetical protein